jgi:hypothetical protein
MRADMVPGATFPDYELPDHTSTPRKLGELQGEDPRSTPSSSVLKRPTGHLRRLKSRESRG